MADMIANETSERIKAALAATPGGVLENIARDQQASLREVLDCLPAGEAVPVAPAHFEAIWQDLTEWGPIMYIVHTDNGVFETKGAIPPGSFGRGYFNIHGDSPIGGHLKMDRCAAIYFVDRPFFGRRSCSVQFISTSNDIMFKIFVGRDEAREMLPDQLARFEALRATFAG